MQAQNGSPLDRWLAVRHPDELARQRGLLLNYLLLGYFAFSLLLTLINSAAFLRTGSVSDGVFIIGDIVSVFFLAGCFLLNRRGRVGLASYLFLAFNVVGVTLLFQAEALDRSLVLYSLPIIIASFLISPGSSFPVALCAALAYGGVYLWSRADFPYNYISIPALFMVSLVSWLVAATLERRSLERDRADRALQEKTRELDQYFVSSLDLLCIADTDGYFRRLNPEWEKTLGYSVRDLEGKRFLDLVHPEDVPSTLERFAALKAQSEVRNFSNRYRCADGGYRWLEWRSIPHGKLIYAVARDITERIFSEQALRQSEERYQRITHAVTDYIYHVRVEDGRAAETTHGPGCVAVTGYSPEELQADPGLWRAMIEPADRPAVDAMAADVLAGRLADPVEHRILRKDGSRRWVRNTPVVHTDPAGRLHSYDGLIRDITDRKLAEAAMRESERRYRSFVQNFPGIAFRADLNLAPEFIHGAVESLSGYSEAEFLRDTASWPRLILPEDQPVVQEVLRRLSEAPNLSIEIECRIRRKDGTVRWVNALVAGVSDDAGRPCGIHGTLYDITDRKAAESDMRESRRMLETVLDTIPARVFWKDADSKYLGCNISFARDAGFASPSEIIGRDDLQMGWKEQAAAYRADDAEVVTTGKAKLKYEESQIAPDGARTWLRTSKVPLTDLDGRVRGVLGTYEDITEQRVAKDELQASRREAVEFSGRLTVLLELMAELSRSETVDDLLRRAVEMGRDRLGIDRLSPWFLGEDRMSIQGTYGIDPEGRLSDEREAHYPVSAESHIWPILQGQKPFELFHDAKLYTKGQLVGRGDRATASLQDGERVLGFISMDNLLRKESITEHDCELLRIFAFVLGHLVSLKRAQEALIHLKDGLEQRVAERTAQLSETAARLESANRELESFSYSISHDLRAPLRAITGFSRVLMEDYGPQLDAEAARICSVIDRNTKRMNRLIDDLLAFSRLGRAEMLHSDIDMGEMADAVFRDLSPAESRDRIDFYRGSLPRVRGDPSMLRQVWTNLLSNAIKFSSKRDRARIEVSGHTEHGEAVFHIRDNGAGFNMQYSPKLFGVFQRLHSDQEFEGTGVGLAIVQRVVHRHAGRVWAEGELDRGAQFSFALPAVFGPE